MDTINLCSNCAANNEGKCFIKDIKIKKGRKRCKDYASVDSIFFAPPYDEYLEEHNYC